MSLARSPYDRAARRSAADFYGSSVVVGKSGRTGTKVVLSGPTDEQGLIKAIQAGS